MSYTLQGQKLREAIELLLNKMIKLGLIKPHEKEALVEKVSRALEAAYPNGQVPLEVINNSAQQKNIMKLIICASIEQTLTDPKLKSIFNTDELAKAFFTPGDTSPKAKQQISAFLLALKFPAPGLKRKTDEMADEILAQKKRFDTEEQDVDADMTLDDKLTAELAEFNYVQAFGNSPDGTPIVVALQTSNTLGATDNTIEINSNFLGYLKEDQNPNNPNVNPDVKAAIQEHKKDLGIEMGTFNKELVDHRIAPNIAAPTPTPGGGGSE